MDSDCRLREGWVWLATATSHVAHRSRISVADHPTEHMTGHGGDDGGTGDGFLCQVMRDVPAPVDVRRGKLRVVICRTVALLVPTRLADDLWTGV